MKTGYIFLNSVNKFITKITSVKILAFIIILLILGFSFFTKIQNLFFSFNLDEILTVLLSKSSIFAILSSASYDPSYPPLYFIFTKLWIMIMGKEESAIRILPVLCNMSAIILILLFIKKIFSIPLIISVCFLLSSSHILFSMSRYARAYSLIFLLSVIVFFTLSQYLNHRKDSWLFITALISGTIGIYSHYCFALFLFFYLISSIIFYRQDKTAIKSLLIYYFLVFLLFWPWLSLFIKNQFWPAYPWLPFATQYSNRWSGINIWIETLTNDLLINIFPKTYIPYLNIFMIIFLDISLLTSYLNINNKNSLKFIILFTFISLNGILFTPIHNLFDLPRYGLFIVFGIYLSIPIMITQIKSALFKLVLIILIIIFSLYSFRTLPRFQIDENWKAAANFMSKSDLKNAVILFKPCFYGVSFNYYYLQKTSEYCFLRNHEYMYLPIWDPQKTNKIYFVTVNSYLNEEIPDNLYSFLKKDYTKKVNSFDSIIIIEYSKL
jgi:uncharacterized membrane protein